MNDLEAIDARVSRRAYLETPIDSTKLAILQRKIAECNNEGNVFIKWIEEGAQAFNGLTKSYGMFKSVKSLIALIGKKEDPNLKEKLGYYGEKLVLEATSLGLGTCWVAGTFDRNDPVLATAPDEELVCVITIGNVDSQRAGKEKFIYKLTHRKSKSLEDFYTSTQTPPAWFIAGIGAAQKAPSAVNRQPVHFDYSSGEARASVSDKYALNLIDLGIAKLHFEIGAVGKFELGNGEKFIKN